MTLGYFWKFPSFKISSISGFIAVVTRAAEGFPFVIENQQKIQLCVDVGNDIFMCSREIRAVRWIL